MSARIRTLVGAFLASIALGLVGALLLFGDEPIAPVAAEDGAAPSSTVASDEPTSDDPAATTAAPGDATTTSSTFPPVAIAVNIEGEVGLSAAVAGLYQWVGDRSVDAAALPEGLVEHLAPIVPDEDLTLAGTADLGSVDDDGRVAVVYVDDDIVLAADEGDGQGWRVVGARLTRYDSAPWYGNPVRRMLLVGSDARPGYIEEVFRADSIHILSSNLPERAGSIVGFPRDTYVDAPYGGKDKFTHINALADDNTESMVRIAAELSGHEIEGYLITGFDSFTRMIDAFGGVIVDVPFSMAEPKSKAYLSAGEQRLNGANALAFTRNRTITGGDLKRSFHQGIVVEAGLVDTQAKGFEQLPALLEILAERTWTNLSAGDLLTLGATAFELDPELVTNIVLPGESTIAAGGAAVVILDPVVEQIFADLDDGILTPETVTLSSRFGNGER